MHVQQHNQKPQHISLIQAKLLSEHSQPLTYTFHAGASYLITGSNGAGKSTLLDRLAGVEDIAAGTITLGSEQLSSKSWRGKSKWNKTALLQIQHVSQHVEDKWFGGTVQQELKIIKQQYRKHPEFVEAQLDHQVLAFGITEEIQAQELISLSVGQQRRLALAIAFSLPAAWLLLDEPFAGLDHAGKQQLLKSIVESQQQGKGLIIVSHQLQELAAIVDKKLVLDEYGIREANEALLESDQALFNKLMGYGYGVECEKESKRVECVQKNENIKVEFDSQRAVGEVGSKLKVAEEVGEGASVLTSKDRHARERFIMKQTTWFDPRALMLGMLICSVSLVLWDSWWSIVIYGLLSITTSMLLRQSLKPWLGLIMAYSIMSIIFTVVGGLSFNPLGFDIESALPIARRMAALLIIIVLGLPLLSLMTPFRLQRALQQSLRPLRRLRVPIDSYAILVSLIFRLIPILTLRWRVLFSLCRTRFKQVGLFKWSMMNALMLAYMRSLLLVADQVATSLEFRGFERISGQSKLHAKVEWRKQDHLLMLILIAIAIMNAAIHQ